MTRDAKKKGCKAVSAPKHMENMEEARYDASLLGIDSTIKIRPCLLNLFSLRKILI